MTIYPGGPQDGIKYTMTAPDGNVAVFNDSTDPNYVGMASFSGLDDADVREAIDVRSASDGGVQGLNFTGPRAVVGTVQIAPTSTTDRNAKFQLLKRAANALRADGTLDFTPDGGLPSRVYFRKNGPIRRETQGGLVVGAQFPLMAADPTIYSQTEHTTTVGASPWQATITNQGDGESAPTTAVTITSAGTVSVANLTTGETILTDEIDPTNFVTFTRAQGSAGTANGQFSAPVGTAIDNSNNIYVADYNNHRVQKFNSAGVWQQNFGTGFGSGNGQLNHPVDVAVDGSGNVYVGEAGNKRAQKFNSSGTYQSKTTTAHNDLTSIALDAAGSNLFTLQPSAPGVATIRKFGTASLGAATLSVAPGTMTNASGIAIDGSGNPWVTDLNSARVYKLNSSLAITNTYGSTGSGDGQFRAPYGIDFDGSGNVLVADYSRNDIQKFSSSMVFQTRFGSFGAGDAQFAQVTGLSAKSTTVVAADRDNNRIQVFNLGGTGVLEFNHATASVYLSTGINMYGDIDVGGTTWWSLNPGDNAIQVVGPGVTTYTMTWRDAWL